MSAQSGEGRLKSTIIYSKLNPEILKLYKDVRDIFDPFKTLNPGVKQDTDIKSIIPKLNANFSNSDIASSSLHY